MIVNTYNNDDQLKMLEEIFDKAVKKNPDKVKIIELCRKGCSCSHSINDRVDKEFDISALNKFKDECEKHGYFAYWEKPSWAYNTMQYLAVYRTEQQYNSNRSNWA